MAGEGAIRRSCKSTYPISGRRGVVRRGVVGSVTVDRFSSSFNQSYRSVVGTGVVVEPVVPSLSPLFASVDDMNTGPGVGAGVARMHTRPVTPLLGP